MVNLESLFLASILELLYIHYVIKCFCLFQGTCQTGPKGEKGEMGPPGMPAESRESDFRFSFRVYSFCLYFLSLLILLVKSRTVLAFCVII